MHFMNIIGCLVSSQIMKGHLNLENEYKYVDCYKNIPI